MPKNSIFLLLLIFLFIPTPTHGAGKCVLAFSVMPDKTQVNPGETIKYAVKLKNIGKGTCMNASYSFQYSSDEDFVSSVPSPRSGDYYWSVGTLKPNKQYTSTLITKAKLSDADNTELDTEAWATADSAADVYAAIRQVVLVEYTEDVPSVPPISTSSPAVPSVPPVSVPSPIIPVTPIVDIQAWVYPGNPSCNAQNEYSDGRLIHTLKPEYYTVLSDGTLRLKTVAVDGCNAYSASNASSIKEHSQQQFVTVSGGISNIRKLFSSNSLQNSAITTLVNFAVQIGFTGIELDWEGFGDWTATDYSNYKNFVTSLQNSLHEKGKLLMIDAPAISDATYQGYFNFKYEDFTHIDYVAIMAYDFQYDFGVGEPVAPDFWITNVVKWAKNKLPLDKIIIGVASYGYHGVVGSYDVLIDTYSQSSTYSGFSTRKINADGEGAWIKDGIYYSVQEVSTIDSKMELLESLGVKSISFWHLGGNQWFSDI